MDAVDTDRRLAVVVADLAVHMAAEEDTQAAVVTEVATVIRMVAATAVTRTAVVTEVDMVEDTAVDTVTATPLPPTEAVLRDRPAPDLQHRRHPLRSRSL